MNGPCQVFLLSPAHLGGKRAQLLFRDGAGFDLAQRLQAGGSASVCEIYTFVSGLYFRGKLAYARAFAKAPPTTPGIQVISNNRGLLSEETLFTLEELRQMGTVDIQAEDPRFRTPLLRDAQQLSEQIGPDGEVVLLGSIATGKYVDVLLEVFGTHLLFPSDFVGRGDLSRGGLCLRAASEGKELPYEPVLGAVRTGRRPPKLGAKTY